MEAPDGAGEWVARGGAFAPGGRHLPVAVTAVPDPLGEPGIDHGLAVVDVAGGDVRVLDAASVPPGPFAWSPDGRWLFAPATQDGWSTTRPRGTPTCGRSTSARCTGSPPSSDPGSVAGRRPKGALVARPIIGVTTYVERAQWGVWDAPAALLPAAYVTAINDAGGRSVLLPPLLDGVEEIVALLDGLVVAGGADIDPSLYGAPRHPRTSGLRPDRDRAEVALLETALADDLPVLAICRGMQLLNVVRGGDLVQHLDGDLHRPTPGRFSHHPVRVDRASRLARLVGEEPLVTSHHHQAPGRIGSGLRAVARAPDGVVEAIEDPGAGFALGVLWHPEEGDDGSLFSTLVETARSSRMPRAAGGRVKR